MAAALRRGVQDGDPFSVLGALNVLFDGPEGYAALRAVCRELREPCPAAEDFARLGEAARCLDVSCDTCGKAPAKPTLKRGGVFCDGRCYKRGRRPDGGFVCQGFTCSRAGTEYHVCDAGGGKYDRVLSGTFGPLQLLSEEEVRRACRTTPGAEGGLCGRSATILSSHMSDAVPDQGPAPPGRV